MAQFASALREPHSIDGSKYDQYALGGRFAKTVHRDAPMVSNVATMRTNTGGVL